MVEWNEVRLFEDFLQELIDYGLVEEIIIRPKQTLKYELQLGRDYSLSFSENMIRTQGSQHLSELINQRVEEMRRGENEQTFG